MAQKRTLKPSRSDKREVKNDILAAPRARKDVLNSLKTLELSPSERRFVETFIENDLWLKGARERHAALVDAGVMSPQEQAQSQQTGSRAAFTRFMGYPRVRVALRAALEMRNDDLLLSRDRVTYELARLAFVNIRDFFTTDGDGNIALRSLDDVSDDALAAVAELNVTTTTSRRVGDADIIDTKQAVRFKLNNKLTALDQLAAMIPKPQAEPTPDTEEHDKRDLHAIARDMLSMLAEAAHTKRVGDDVVDAVIVQGDDAFDDEAYDDAAPGAPPGAVDGPPPPGARADVISALPQPAYEEAENFSGGKIEKSRADVGAGRPERRLPSNR